MTRSGGGGSAVKNESERGSANGSANESASGKRSEIAGAAQMAVMAVVTVGVILPLWIPLREAPGGVASKEAGELDGCDDE